MVKLYQFFFLVLLLFAPAKRTSSAAPLSASELISEVNALRVNQGLEPYQADWWLMSYAQEHADYCASLGHGTHQHSDGTYPSEHGIQENVAEGSEGFITVDLVVYTVWSDSVHMDTMVGNTTGQVGVGMAVKDGWVYYTLNVLPDADSQDVTPQATATGTLPTQAPTSDMAATATPADFTFVPILTNTPLADGSIIHIVKAGETLWSIALSYNVKVEELRWLNGLESDSNEIYVEQRLLILPGYTPTPTAAFADTPVPTPLRPTSTPTPSPSRTPAPPEPTETSAAVQSTSPAPTAPPPYISRIDLKSLGIGALAGILILLAVGANEFRRLRNR